MPGQRSRPHDDLATAHCIREWLATRSDQALIVGALEVLYTWSRDVRDTAGLDARLNGAQRGVLSELFTSASHLDRNDYITAVNRVGVDVLRSTTLVNRP